MKIGPISFANNTILAPMAGVTDLPFRNICRQKGAGAVVAEMLTSNQSLWNSRKSQFRQVQKSEPGVRWIQILGNDPQQMADAAMQCESNGAHIIDINMGCPAKKVCRKAAGSALLRDEVLVAEILQSVVQSVKIPVTLKIRTGWSKENQNGLNIAQIADKAGIQAISVHGRTRECRYNVEAEYDTVARIKQAVSVPIIVNGDICTIKKAQTVLDQTKADGIMIGRGALGNPWLFNELSHYLENNEVIAPPDLNEIHQTIISHLSALHQFYGEHLGVRISRKHLSWYQEKFDNVLKIKHLFNKLEKPQDQISFIDQYFENEKKQSAVKNLNKNKQNIEITRYAAPEKPVPEASIPNGICDDDCIEVSISNRQKHHAA